MLLLHKGSHHLVEIHLAMKLWQTIHPLQVVVVNLCLLLHQVVGDVKVTTCQSMWSLNQFKKGKSMIPEVLPHMLMVMRGVNLNDHHVKLEGKDRVRAEGNSQNQGSAMPHLLRRQYKEATQEYRHLQEGIRDALLRRLLSCSNRPHRQARHPNCQVFLEPMLVVNRSSCHPCFIQVSSSVSHVEVNRGLWH
jgi:hypothetical protein